MNLESLANRAKLALGEATKAAVAARKAGTRATSDLVAKAENAKNSFTSSPRFEEYCRSTFDELDLDKSGFLCMAEVYAAVLLVYTKIIPYVTTAIVPSHAEVISMAHQIDADKVSAWLHHPAAGMCSALTRLFITMFSTNTLVHFSPA